MKNNWEKEFDKLKNDYHIVRAGNNCDKRWFEIKDFISHQIEQAKQQEREEIVKEIKQYQKKLPTQTGKAPLMEMTYQHDYGYNHALKEIQQLINKRQ